MRDYKIMVSKAIKIRSIKFELRALDWPSGDRSGTRDFVKLFRRFLVET